MRKTNYFLLFLLLFMAFFQGCEKTDDGTYTAPITLYEKIGGKWALNSITEVDEVAKVNNLKPVEEVLTTRFKFTSFAISLHVDSSYQPTTYEVTGSAPELFANNGYWKLDEPFVHADQTSSNILLYSDEAKTQLTDVLTIVTLPGTKNLLDFTLTRMDNGTPFVSYAYKFRHVN
jgi:Domain of unknown function (DUF5004)